MKRLIFVALMLVCSASWAEWEVCGVGDLAASFYCDKSTIRKNGSISRMWTMVTFASIQNFWGKRAGSWKQLVAYNCNTHTSAVISMVTYSDFMGRGKVTLAETIPEREQEWYPVQVPEDSNDMGNHYTYWKIACGKK